ncbi:MAG: hypothetical protein JO279_07365 [Verrucomicrobia bacterium]|nr:hypothetical protein [Verrucomicrobiota bacterium]MBV8376809.1 hypothetical protein [Verrucomicrobiota bacterium]
MKTTTLLALAAAAALALKSTASANKYDELVAKGFRWATADGLYACVSKDDVRRMANNPGDSVELKMIEQVKAYFLTPGTIVQVIEGDTSTGTSKIRLAGITSDLWTLTRFLSKHPIKDTYGVIETPETSGLIPTASPGFNAGPTPSPEFSPLPGANASPGGSPTGSPSPNPNETALPNESPTPNATPTPDESPTPASGQ